MFVEERIYTLQPGKIPEYLKLYQEEGRPIQMRILPALVGYYTSEIGTLNVVVHMWAYEDLKQRSEYRAKLMADPAWQAYTRKVQPLMIHQESRILNPTPFFAAQLETMIKASQAA